MQIVEVKNNLVKVSYDTAEENLILSGFIVIKDSVQAFIGQIIHLDANDKGNFAVVKLLFVFDDNGVITGYNGSIPDAKSLLDIVHPNELLEILPVQNPVILGELAQQKTTLKLDRTFLEENLLVCSEKTENNALLIENFAKQLQNGGKKLLVIDTVGNLAFSQNKIVAGVDFKLPLNYESINFIYEKGLEDSSPETKALIQEVFLEVQNYVKTLPEQFIPFQDFKNVVDAQYEETELVELVLLKNKLLKYYEEGIFAQNMREFDSLAISLEESEPTIFDISNVDEKIQREMISYAYSVVNELNEELNQEIYVICNIDNENSDKKLLKQIFMSKNTYSTIICAYSYKYLKELKQLSKNLILFAPIQQQNDFAGYNTFLNKLNQREFIIYGNSTQYLPLIVRLEKFTEQQTEEARSQQQTVNSEEETATKELAVEPSLQPSIIVEEDLLDAEIRQDVDQIYMAPKQEDFNIEVVDNLHKETELTEEDLDLLDDLGGIDEGGMDVLKDGGMEDYVLDQPSKDVASDDFNVSGEEDEDESYTSIPPYIQPSEEQEEIEPSEVEILPVKTASTPIVPIYSADIEPKAESDALDQGDIVSHPKYGKGTVEKLITYGSKTLCSINFDNVGRRLLDPTLVELKRVNGE